MSTFQGGRLHIGTTVAASTQSEFEADSYVEVKNLSNMGPIGASANVVSFPLVSDDFIKKSKGGRNAGDPAVVVEYDARDPGQVAMRAAEQTKFYYNFKLELANAESADETDSVCYFRAIVAGVPRQFGGQEDFVTETYTLGIYPRPLWVESELITSP